MDSIGQGIAFSPKWTETKFTMAAVADILKIRDRRKSKGTFPYPPPTCTVEMDSIGQGVLPEIDGNQIYDGCHIENQESAENRKESSPTHPQHAQLKWIRSAKAFSPKLTETKFTMAAVAAILKIRRAPKIERNLPLPTPNMHS
jgi:hypothetical protein